MSKTVAKAQYSKLGGFRVNGHIEYFDRLQDFRMLRPGKYTVRHSGTGEEYRIEGGKHCGGGKKDWYVECDTWSKPIRCTSVMDALRMLEGM